MNETTKTRLRLVVALAVAGAGFMLGADVNLDTWTAALVSPKMVAGAVMEMGAVYLAWKTPNATDAKRRDRIRSVIPPSTQSK